MGFLRDVERINQRAAGEEADDALLGDNAGGGERLTRRLLKKPVKVAVDPVSSTVELIEQKLYYVNKGNKAKL